MKFSVKNWAKYEAGLKQRGSLTLWITPEAIAQWRAVKRTIRGAQAIYSDLSIDTFLMLRLAFGMPVRQTEGLMASILALMGLGLRVPDHTTVAVVRLA